jgi:hypothetical protein
MMMDIKYSIANIASRVRSQLVPDELTFITVNVQLTFITSLIDDEALEKENNCKCGDTCDVC